MRDDSVRLARDVVGFTRRAARQYNRAHSSTRDLFIDVYSNALAGGCVLMMAASLVVALRDEIMGRSVGKANLVAAHWQALPAGVLWMILTYLALVGIVLLARKLGPVTVSRAEGAWWLPLPLDRRPMVLASFRTRLVSLSAVAALAYVPFSFLTAIDRSPWAHAGSAVAFGGGVVLAVAGAAILQLMPTSGALRTGILVGLAPVAVLPFLASAVWPLVLVLIAAVVLAAYVLSRIGDVSGAELQRGGAVSGHAAASIFSSTSTSCAVHWQPGHAKPSACVARATTHALPGGPAWRSSAPISWRSVACSLRPPPHWCGSGSASASP
ncbi:hypothetical protein MN0502_02450 [Arthrobacter sp. MN05-02]|nr:hypothetical protein MN0502_02450 [Arthrobacter sp. MN05-02]